MTEYRAQFEANRLGAQYGRTFSVIACERIDCTWCVIVPGDVTPARAATVVIALGGSASVIDGKLISVCEDCSKPSLALAGGTP